jgi:hypothetical protein
LRSVSKAEAAIFRNKIFDAAAANKKAAPGGAAFEIPNLRKA